MGIQDYQRWLGTRKHLALAHGHLARGVPMVLCHFQEAEGRVTLFRSEHLLGSNGRAIFLSACGHRECFELT